MSTGVIFLVFFRQPYQTQLFSGVLSVSGDVRHGRPGLGGLVTHHGAHPTELLLWFAYCGEASLSTIRELSL